MDQELTAFLIERFGEISRRFDDVYRRFDSIDQRFDSIDQRFDAVDRRFDATDRKIDEKFEEAKRHFGVLADDLRGQIRVVADGHVGLERP